MLHGFSERQPFCLYTQWGIVIGEFIGTFKPTLEHPQVVFFMVFLGMFLFKTIVPPDFPKFFPFSNIVAVTVLLLPVLVSVSL